MRNRLSDEERQRIRDEMMECRNPRLADVIERNIGIIEVLRRESEANRTTQDRIADVITNWSGSMMFVYVHIVWFGIWLVLNLNFVPGLKAFDPFPFSFLTMVVSLEAIFLSTFVLVSQNKQGELSSQREALDLQINLLAEYEITRMLRLVDKMAEKMGIEDAYDEEIDQLTLPVAPDVVLQEIEARSRQV
ncbi:DUF1003 domain-containing protein [Fimbriimonas ginsengisoli]|uniref:DUF1003 domain-containing protein n=1 Tax=Fimbriimonas ginsengisoli Gsoil 348 TaxID=661478 RepID=A0A068NWP1_FIMGI|nr:DUF1003 domain-containing protein [Fimbriimonas ginsengisoli]AIE87787.1 hypothetical protein OP10G_4419 [Fimbriimonas ginsengisoli Gsoil 348]